MDKKYELLYDDTTTIGKTKLYRIKALRDFDDVKAGSLGGYIESESNLSHDGNCWAYDFSKLHDNCRVYESGKVYGNAQIHNNAQVYGNAQIRGDVHLHDNVQVYGCSIVRGKSRLFGNVQVYEYGEVGGDAKIYGNIQIYGEANCIDNKIQYDIHRCDYDEHIGC